MLKHIKAKENSQSKEAQLCRKPPNLATLFPPEVTQKSSMRDLIILSEIHTHTHTLELFNLSNGE